MNNEIFYFADLAGFEDLREAETERERLDEELESVF